MILRKIQKIITSRVWQIFVHTFALIGFFLVTGFFAVKYGLTNTEGIIDRQSEYFGKNQTETKQEKYVWNTGEEWDNFKNAITKDIKILKRVQSETDIPARLIIAPVFVEQMRLYHTDRALFKSLFSPLKILGTQTQFSLGVSGIKQQTAEQIEKNLKDKTSPYYLGEEYEHYLDFETTNIEEERFKRLTDYKNRYYSYLYTALYIKELETGWQKSGVDIKNRPDIIATLFNIGFNNSHPHSNPETGGALITIQNTNYSFGRLAGEFYASEEMIDFFPHIDR